MRQPRANHRCADREEKRVTCGTVREKVQEHLDHNDPNQRRLFKRTNDAVGQGESAGRLLDTQLDDAKFIASYSRHSITRPDMTGQAPGNYPQKLIACNVTIPIVYLLESVEIQKQKPNLCLQAAGNGDSL